MIYILLYIFLGVLSVHIASRYTRRGRILRKIQGPTAYPVVGNLLPFYTNCLHEFWLQARKISENFYPITRFWFWRDAVISVRHPDDLEILFTSSKCIKKGYIYDSIQPWLKTGLLTSTGEKWRHRRKVLTPAFHFRILKKYLEIVSEESKKAVGSLNKEGQKIISLLPFSSKHTLNIICESAMGVSLQKMNKEIVEEYENAIHDFGKVIIFRMPRPYIMNWMVNYIRKIGSLQRNALKILHHFTDKIIEERRKYHKQVDDKYLNELSDYHEQNAPLEKEEEGKKRLAMLDLLLEAERNGLIDHDGIKEEVDTFTFEGHDTTAMALAFTLFLLAENQDAQKLARIEITKLYNETNGAIQISHLQEMHYLERCIKESLRLYPPVATILRVAEEDLQLKHALAPADTHIIIHLYDTHRDPNFWTDPDKFDPDRFLPDRSKNRHPFAYVPFSAGPRNCIGQKFAMLELKSLISQLLYNFNLESVDSVSDMKLTADLVLRPLDPIRIKFIQIRE